MPRTRPVTLSTRARREEAALIRAAAEAEGLPVAELMHRILVPAVKARLVELAGDPSSGQGGGQRPPNHGCTLIETEAPPA